MSVNVLPDMDEPRLKTLGKQLNRSRKASVISHDRLKDKLEVYEKSLNKEKKSISGKYHVRKTRLTHSLVNTRGTQKCLKAKREQSFWEDSDEYPYGIYEGESLSSYRRQVDTLIERRHPRYRRMQKVERYLQTGKVSGKILDDEDAKMQFEMIMRGEKRGVPKETAYMHRENPLTLTFLNDTKQNKVFWKSPNSLLSKTKFGVPDLLSPRVGLPDIYPEEEQNTNGFITPSDTSSTLEEASYLTVRSSPTKLNLPPIIAGKEFIKNKHRRTTKLTLPNLSIRRATKHDTSVTEDPMQKLAQLKGRRATTFI